MRWLLLLCLASGCEVAPRPPGNGDVLRCPDPQVAEVTPTFPTHAGWNDYVRLNDAKLPRYRQVDAPCLAESDGSYFACVHGGEARRVDVPGLSSCAGVSAGDALGVFAWRCDDAGGVVSLFSTGLRGERGLADLLDGAAFRENHVTVRRDTCVVAESLPAIWWDNPVIEVPPATTEPVALDVAGAVYVVTTSRETAGYVIEASRQALVTLPGAILTMAAEAPGECTDENLLAHAAIVCAHEPSFAWIEGSFAGHGNGGLYFVEGTRLRLHRLRMRDQEDGAALIGVSASLVSDSVASHMSHKGIDLRGGERNTVKQGRADRCGHTGIHLAETSTAATDLVATNNNIGVSLEFNRDFTLTDVLVANNDVGLEQKSGDGVTMSRLTLVGNITGGTLSGTGLALVNAVVAGNRHGLVVDGGVDGIFRHLAVGGNEMRGLAVLGSSSLMIDGLLMVGGNGVDCYVETPDQAVALDGACHYGPDLARAALVIDVAQSFAGAVLDDGANPTDVGGLWLNASDAVADWSSFDGPTRAWLPAGSDAFPAPSLVGPCAIDSLCRIWDWRLRDDDLMLRHRFGELYLGARCPASLDGTAAETSMTDAEDVPNTFLVSARELSGDSDGLCEAGEECVFAPNVGAYQGEGGIADGGCDVVPGTFGDTRMRRYVLP